MSSIQDRAYDAQYWPEDSSIVRCIECDGTGVDQRLAYNIHTGEEVKVTEIAWLMLPKTESEARAKNQNYCRSEGNCPICKGLGEVRKEGNAYYPLY